MDGAGNVYIADYSNYRIRKVDFSGIITTIAARECEGSAVTAVRRSRPSKASPLE